VVPADITGNDQAENNLQEKDCNPLFHFRPPVEKSIFDHG